MGKIKLFILDMDGLMFDTGSLSYKSYLKAAEEYNFEIIHNVYYYLTGRTEKEIRKHMEILYGEDQPTEKWRDAINEYKSKILADEKRVYKKKGLKALLNYAREKNIKTVIASSSSKELIEYYLEIEGIKDYIDFIVAGDEVTNSKPHPEIFIKACKKAGISKEKSIVFEDSLVGIDAAENAGIRSILVQDDIHRLGENEGYFKLKKDISDLESHSLNFEYEFDNLIEARDFLKQND